MGRLLVLFGLPLQLSHRDRERLGERRSSASRLPRLRHLPKQKASLIDGQDELWRRQLRLGAEKAKLSQAKEQPKSPAWSEPRRQRQRRQWPSSPSPPPVRVLLPAAFPLTFSFFLSPRLRCWEEVGEHGGGEAVCSIFYPPPHRRTGGHRHARKCISCTQEKLQQQEQPKPSAANMAACGCWGS